MAERKQTIAELGLEINNLEMLYNWHPKDKDERAEKIIILDGSDGFRTAASVVGPDEAERLLTRLIMINMGSFEDKVRLKAKEQTGQFRREKGF